MVWEDVFYFVLWRKEKWKSRDIISALPLRTHPVKPHIGNTYEVVLADAIARLKKTAGL